MDDCEQEDQSEEGRHHVRGEITGRLPSQSDMWPLLEVRPQ